MLGKIKILLSQIILIRNTFRLLKKYFKIFVFLTKYLKNLIANKCFFAFLFVIIFFIPLLIIFSSIEKNKPNKKIPKMQYTLG